MESVPGLPRQPRARGDRRDLALGAQYLITTGVISRYRRQRQHDGDHAPQSLSSLLGLYERLGGMEAFIEWIGSSNRVSTRPGGALKGAAVHQAACTMTALGIDTASDFRAAACDLAGAALQAAWTDVPGQSSCISWRYLRMLVGLPDVQPDQVDLPHLRRARPPTDPNPPADARP